MKHKFAIAAGLLALLAPGRLTASIAFVQAKQGTNSGTPATVTFTSNNAAGNLIVACAEANNSSSTISMSDSRNSYSSAIGPSQQNGGGNQWVQCFYAKNIGAGANTVTATSTGATYMDLVAVEYSGADTAAPLDGSGASATGNSAAPDTGSFSVTSGDLVCGFALGAGSLAAGSGYTSRGTDTFSMMEDQTASGATADAAFTASSGNWVAIAAAFKVAATGGNKGTATGAGAIAGAGKAS